MLYAAKEETAPVFFLAASFASFPPSSVAENSHPGHRLPTAVLHRGFAPVISNTATGFGGCLYDFGRRSRSTGKERDAETGLDFFRSRYMSSSQGRFSSPDPMGIDAANPADPQSWNQYTYGRNNPLLYIDPDGLKYQVCDASGKCSGDSLSDAQFESERASDQANGEYFVNGQMFHFDSNGNRVSDGSYQQTDVDLNPSAKQLFTANKKLWNDTAGAVNTLAVATAVVVAAPVVVDTALSSNIMRVAIGPGPKPWGIHIAYEANGTWLHGAESLLNPGSLEVTDYQAAAYAAKLAWVRIPVPILNPGAVAGTAGTAVSSCLTAACTAFLKGWGH